jgi:hypothetical protein
MICALLFLSKSHHVVKSEFEIEHVNNGSYKEPLLKGDC